MAYASGKHAYFICDTCGFRYPYKEARGNWENFRVCNECYEPKHPQIDPPSIGADAEQLWRPRPEVPLPQAQLGLVRTTGPSNTTDSGVNVGGQPLGVVDPIGTDFVGVSATGSVGTITVTTT